MTEPINPPVNKNPADDLEAKRQAAKVAMQGAEWTAKKETESKRKTLQDEESVLAQALAKTTHEKEALELAWIDLDNTRKTIRAVLNPFLEAEKVAETEETTLEAEEAKIGLAADKHTVEEKRWAAQAKRREIETKKWAEEEKLAKIEKTLEENTKQYRGLLDQEDKTTSRLSQVRMELKMANGQ